MKALSIKQPWAHLIIHHGKDIENRSWPTKYRGPLLIHASKGICGDGFRAARLILPQGASWYADDHDKAERGGIIGMVELVDCVEAHPSPWFQGPYGFVLRNIKPLPFHPCSGRLGFFVPEGWNDTPAHRAPAPEDCGE